MLLAKKYGNKNIITIFSFEKKNMWKVFKSFQTQPNFKSQLFDSFDSTNLNNQIDMCSFKKCSNKWTCFGDEQKKLRQKCVHTRKLQAF